uniref:Uncharacterized protein n=1 Tax=Siphoviridae sp. ctEeW6 TaxID=2827816 RepID=A0A8S5T1K2_9CAUD|nr:MAG TPA: hypothetical protein [Siphoviridae sp. ctEeW6]
MDSNELRQAIRKIIGYPEKTNQSQEARQGKRVLGGVGEYWYNGYGSNGDKKKGDDDKKGGKKKGGKKGGGGDDDKAPIGDPLRRPQVGEPMPRLEGLHDCDTGQCVAVNFDPNMVKKPDGWQDPCTPPTAKKGEKVYKISLVFRLLVGGGASKVIKVVYTRNPKQYDSIAHRIINEAPFDPNTKLYPTDKPPNFPYKLSNIIYYYGAWVRKMWYGGSQRAEAYATLSDPMSAQGGEELDDGNGGKPSDCAEMVAGAGGFKPACENASGYPPNLQKETMGFTLCDAEGNPVDIETNGRGWKITTKDYTAIVDEEFTVQSVTDN